MKLQTASVVISRPPAEVFAYLDDVSREHEWQPNLKSAEQDPAGPTRVGTRKAYSSSLMGREVRNTYVVTELEPARRIVCEATEDSMVEARSEVVCEAEGAGTRVEMRVDWKPKGALRLVPRKMLEAAYGEELQETLGRLKARLEG